jgi:hypothetical protein
MVGSKTSLLVMHSPSFIVCRRRRICPTSLCSIHSVAGARRDLHVCRSEGRLLALVSEFLSRDTNAYCSPSARHHEVFRLLVCECNEAGRDVSELFEKRIAVRINDAENNRKRTQERPRTRVFSCGSGPPADAG